MIEINLRTDSLKPTPLHHHWSVCVGAGRAAEGLRAAWQEQLRFAVDQAGFRYVRFHGLFHDDMFIWREEQGRVVLNFQYVDELFDRLLEIGIKPFVEFGFCPGEMAREKGTVFWWNAHGSPPVDLKKWSDLVSAITRHWIDRYGADEVRSWYFEVWNEPNLDPFFRGTKSEYFELYRATALAVKGVDAKLRVGGPATSNFVPDARFDGEKEDPTCHASTINSPDLDALEWKPVWLEDFFGFCFREGLPVDFVSCHPYPTDWALDSHGQGRKLTRGVNATPDDLALLRRMVDASPFPKAEIHLTEWNSSSSPRDFAHDFLPAATYIVRTNAHSIGTVDSLAYWTFTDVFEEGGAGDTIFHGGFGMINLQGIVKPTLHAYRFLHGLGDELVARTENTLVTRDKVGGKLSCLAWHYPPEMPLSVPASFETRDKAREVLAMGKPEKLHIRIEGLRPGAEFELEILDHGHGNAMQSWEEMQCPEPPTREQCKALRQAALATHSQTLRADQKGCLNTIAELTPWAVAALRELS